MGYNHFFYNCGLGNSMWLQPVSCLSTLTFSLAMQIFYFYFFNKNSKVLVTLTSFAPRHTVAVTRRPNTDCHRGLKVVRRRRGGARRRVMMIFASKGDLTGTQQVTQNIHWRCFYCQCVLYVFSF